MNTRICINPTQRYAIIWCGQHYGAYYWITPASLQRLLCLMRGVAWHQTGIVDNEVVYSRLDDGR